MKLVQLLVVAIVATACVGTETTASIAPEDLLAVGATQYAATCASCHGTELEGTTTGPPLLSRVYEPNHHGDASFVLAVQNGVRGHHFEFGDMPAITNLTRGDIDAITAYVRDVQTTEGFID